MKTGTAIDLQRFKEAKQVIADTQQEFCTMVINQIKDNPHFKCKYLAMANSFVFDMNVNGLYTTLHFEVHPTHEIDGKNYTLLNKLRICCADLSIYYLDIKPDTNLKLYCNSKTLPTDKYVFNGRKLSVQTK